MRDATSMELASEALPRPPCCAFAYQRPSSAARQTIAAAPEGAPAPRFPQARFDPKSDFDLRFPGMQLGFVRALLVFEDRRRESQVSSLTDRPHTSDIYAIQPSHRARFAQRQTLLP